MRSPVRAERGDWSYVASTSFALALLAAVALAVDGESLASAHARLWQAVTVSARAGARCLAPAPQAPTLAAARSCVSDVADRLLDENLAASGLGPVSLGAVIVGQDTVRVSATASVALPIALPGVPSSMSVASQATAKLVLAVTPATS